MGKYFSVLQRGFFPPQGSRNKAFLLVDDWNDYSYRTLFSLVVFDAKGIKLEPGQVKIGQFKMKKDGTRTPIPAEFDSLDEEFFSLGQDETYYATLNSLGPNSRDRILHGLNDVALDEKLFTLALREQVTHTSLLRFVTTSTVRRQFSRLATGGVRLSPFEFTYTYPNQSNLQNSQSELTFAVQPESMPPTNIHVLIGRNGVGKTFTLHRMANSLINATEDSSKFGSFSSINEGRDESEEGVFANLVFVTFSAFDNFNPLSSQKSKSQELKLNYIGIKKVDSEQEGQIYRPKSPQELADEFSESLLICTKSARLTRWKRAIATLATDPYFQAVDVATLAEIRMGENERKKSAKKLFEDLSSGHKIVLLTITKLVETVEERTLILFDEPEAHLHPPLLSAFVRALSDLLLDRNGVAIIATHSPVILQEVPRSCVWKIRSSGEVSHANRPASETFGENVGVLTREVFGLEVTESGFHRLLQDAITSESDFDEVIGRFDSKLGGEARAHIRAILANRVDERVDE